MCIWLRYEGCRVCNLRKQIWFYWFAKKKENKYWFIYSLWSFSDHTSLLKMLFDQRRHSLALLIALGTGLHVRRAPLSSVKEVKRICIRQTKVSWYKVLYERSERALVKLMAQKSASNNVFVCVIIIRAMQMYYLHIVYLSQGALRCVTIMDLKYLLVDYFNIYSHSKWMLVILI